MRYPITQICLTLKNKFHEAANQCLFKNFFFSVVILSVLVLNSCKVTFIPGYDAKIAEQIENTSKAVD